MSIVMTLVCVLLSLVWGGAGMAQDRPPEIVMNSSSVEATVAPEKGQANQADAERRQAGLTSLLGHLRMVFVPGSSFRMGCTREQRGCGESEKPVHEVQVNDFEIGQYEVTQELWEAVMGENPSHFGNCAQCPVENVSWEDVRRFLKKLNVQTEDQYRLPTEAEWEYAARGGQQSRGYPYAGSDTLGLVAWYWENTGGRTHPVGQKEPNELGLYDMSGNVAEWVQDCWHDSYTGAPADGRAWESEHSEKCSLRALRGGAGLSDLRFLLAAFRDGSTSGNRLTFVGFRLARTLTPVEATATPDTGQADRADAERRRQVRLNQLPERLPMVSIPGGSFSMGCTREQGHCNRDQYPVHEVQVGAFEIGQYEVTQEVWEAVMGENPSRFSDCAQCPVESVSFGDVRRFLDELNARTGGGYRLPTEAEWEYAARGGQQSRGYRYAGSNTLDAVAWYGENSGGKTHRVGQKEPNELGLYDMSGNVKEWVQDCWHDSYRDAPADGRAWESEDCSQRVLRGGFWLTFPATLKAAYRDWFSPGVRGAVIGFRVARTPVEGTAAPEKGQADRAAAKRRPAGLTPLLVPLPMVSIPGGRFSMGCTREQGKCYDDENPVHEVQVNDFEMGQYEVTQALWEAVMGENPSWFMDCAQCPVEQVSWDDIQVFLKRLNEQTGSQYRLPTEAEWEYAARGGQQSRGYQYAGSNDPGVVAWYEENTGEKTHPVGQKEPNELGLYDMSGNVWEWVQDCGHDSYRGAPSDGRAWESENSGDCSKRVLRGGSWIFTPRYLRAAYRFRTTPGNRNIDVGVRLARTLTP